MVMKFRIAAAYFKFQGYRDTWLLQVAGEFLTYGLFYEAVSALGEFQSNRHFGGVEHEIIQDLWTELRARRPDELPKYEVFSEEYAELQEEEEPASV